MIQKLIIFENSGICLYSKEYGSFKSKEDDELITGFLSVLFGYLDSQFGKLICITTENSLLLIRNVREIYITLVTSQFNYENQEEDKEKYLILNKRLEQTCKTQLGLLERKVGTLLLKLQLRQEKNINYKNLFADIENELDAIISQGQSKIEIIKKLLENHTITNSLEIYKI